jgi:membrane dipeptidase
MILVDGHEDLAWNAIRFGRDYTRSVAATRALEAGTTTPARNGQCTLGWPEWQRANVAIIFATLFGAPARHRLGDWDVHGYTTVEEAHALYEENLAIYAQWLRDHPDKFRLVQSAADLDAVLATWQSGDRDGRQIGLVYLMEGAEGIRSPDELPDWYAAGVRIIGPCWVSTRYAGGTREPGPLTPLGQALLARMAERGMLLDLSHLAEEAAHQALAVYPGPVMASHSNARVLLPGTDEPDRHLTDALIQEIAARDGVIGIVPYGPYLKGDWKIADGREAIPLARLADQIDYVCQLTGSAQHTAIGTDFDGGFGLESIPPEMDSIADLPVIGDALASRGYTASQIEGILGGNWLRVLRRGLKS